MKYLKGFLIFLSFIPLTIVLLIPSGIINGALVEISYKLLIYKHPWGAEAFIGSIFILALVTALSISSTAAIWYLSSSNIKKISIPIYFIAIFFILTGWETMLARGDYIADRLPIVVLPIISFLWIVLIVSLKKFFRKVNFRV